MRLINITRPAGAWLLGALPFVLLAAAYLIGSAVRLADNPADKLLPSLAVDGADDRPAGLHPRPAHGRIPAVVRYLGQPVRGWGRGWPSRPPSRWCLGLMTAVLPVARALLAPFVAFLSMVPPLALLPVLFIVLGLGEVSKIALIVIGVAPILTRDLALAAAALPREQIVKAETLSASTG
jgi:NitT/TauT family transport system permease protein